MSRREARGLALRRAGELRLLSYRDLKDRWLDQPHCEELTAAGGKTYQVEIEAFWDDPKNPENLRVWVTARGSLFPPVESFIIAPDGSFVGD